MVFTRFLRLTILSKGLFIYEQTFTPNIRGRMNVIHLIPK